MASPDSELIVADSYKLTLVGSIALHPILSPGLEKHMGTISDLHVQGVHAGRQ